MTCHLLLTTGPGSGERPWLSWTWDGGHCLGPETGVVFVRQEKGWRIRSSTPVWAQGTKCRDRWEGPWRSWWPWVGGVGSAAAAAAVGGDVAVAQPPVRDAARGDSMCAAGRTLRGRSGEVEPYRPSWYDGRDPDEGSRPLQQTFG